MIGQTKQQQLDIVTGQTVPNKAFFDDKIGQPFVSLTNALLDRGVSASDYASLTNAITAAKDSSWVLIIPRDYSTDSTLTLSSTNSDTNLIVVDYRGAQTKFYSPSFELGDTTNRLKIVSTQENLSIAMSAMVEYDAILMTSGQFTVPSGGYSTNADNTKVYGSGPSTVLYVNSAVDTVFHVKHDSVEIGNFRIEARDRGEYGVVFTDASFNTIRDVQIDSAGTNGLRFDGTSNGAKDNQIINVLVNKAGGDGVLLTTSDNNKFYGVKALFTGGSGFRLIQSDEVQLFGCEAQQNDDYGVYASSPGTPNYGLTINGGRFSNNDKHNILLTNCILSIVSDAIIKNAGVSAVDTYNGIHLDGSDRCLITGNFFYDYKDERLYETDGSDTLTTNGIAFNATSDSNYAANNFFDRFTMTGISDAGSKNRVPVNWNGGLANLVLNSDERLDLEGFGGDTRLGYNGTDVFINHDGTSAILASDTRVRITNNLFIAGSSGSHELSMYSTAPQAVLTDSDVNVNVSSAAQAIDTSAVMLDAGAAEPRIYHASSAGLITDFVGVQATDYSSGNNQMWFSAGRDTLWIRNGSGNAFYLKLTDSGDTH